MSIRGYRKFLYAGIVVVVFVILFFIQIKRGIEIQENYVKIILYIYLSFILSNITSKAFKEKRYLAISKLGGRKFLFTIIFGSFVMIVATYLNWKQIQIPDAFADFVLGTFSGYLLGNAVSKLSSFMGNVKEIRYSLMSKKISEETNSNNNSDEEKVNFDEEIIGEKEE